MEPDFQLPDYRITQLPNLSWRGLGKIAQLVCSETDVALDSLARNSPSLIA